jgi:hypothetical protein
VYQNVIVTLVLQESYVADKLTGHLVIDTDLKLLAVRRPSTYIQLATIGIDIVLV